MKTLLLQAQLGWKDPARNREHLQSMISGESGGFDLVVLPETFTTGFLGDADLPAEDMNGPTVRWMQELAKHHDSAIAGSAVITEQGHRFNRFLFVTPGGDVYHYDKRHLFAFGGENKRYTPGNERVIVNYLGWRINLQVCYDLRFPAWCRNRNDYDLMLLVANWPSRRVHHPRAPGSGNFRPEEGQRRTKPTPQAHLKAVRAPRAKGASQLGRSRG